MGDSLTSYAGDFSSTADRPRLLAFLNAGAAGSYGTIVEPCNYTQKFPDPLDYFYQDRGFCLAEAYYQSLLNPYQGLLVGEPLSAPFAQPGHCGLEFADQRRRAQRPGRPEASPSPPQRPTCRSAKWTSFLDGSFVQTMTNLPPAAGNVAVGHAQWLRRQLHRAHQCHGGVRGRRPGRRLERDRPTRPACRPTPAGDRLELQSLDVANPGSNVTLSASTAIGTAAQLTTWLTSARPTFLDTAATGYVRACSRATRRPWAIGSSWTFSRPTALTSS